MGSAQKAKVLIVRLFSPPDLLAFITEKPPGSVVEGPFY